MKTRSPDYAGRQTRIAVPAVRRKGTVRKLTVVKSHRQQPDTTLTRADFPLGSNLVCRDDVIGRGQVHADDRDAVKDARKLKGARNARTLARRSKGISSIWTKGHRH